MAAAWAGAPQNDPPPGWAFLLVQPGNGSAPPNAWISVPGSKLKVKQKDIDNTFGSIDWFPQDHGKMPPVVAQGRPPKLWSCSACHAPTGVGGPDSAAIAGLPAAYIAQQFEEFRSGRRSCAVAKGTSCFGEMKTIAEAASPEDVKQAAAYFSAQPYRSRIRVIEAAMVPKTQVGSFFLVRRPGSEPIGQRIIELPDNAARENAGDWRNPITAYVPPGSIARGKALVEKAPACTSCHGAHLQGMGIMPPLAGRSPSYMVRQLYDIQYGFRTGPAVAPMKPVVAHLTPSDRLAIAAYLASVK